MRTTAVRLSALYILLFGLVAVALALYMMRLSVSMLSEQTLHSLTEEVANIEATYQRGGIALLVRTIDRRSRQPGAFLYLIADNGGRILAGNVRSIDSDLLTSTSHEGRAVLYSRFEEGGETRQHKALATIINLPNQMKLMVGRDMGDPEAFVEMIRKAFIWAFAAMALGAVLIWLIIGQRALRRIAHITQASKRLMGGDLSGRLPTSGGGDEFDRLSRNLNIMLERIEALNHGLREVSDNIAHDLRTPLTRLRARAEAALRPEEGEADYPAALHEILHESEQLINTFNAILMISRIEAGTQPAPLTRQNIRPLIEEAVEFYEPVTQEAGVKLTLSAIHDIELALNRELVAQSLFNLIDNALKYARPEQFLKSGSRFSDENCNKNEEREQRTEIVISMQNTQDEARVIVADNGEGIPPSERENVLKRFYRLEKSRTQSGSGIGLSLVAAVMKLHGGRLELEDNEPSGLRATLIFPLSHL